MLDIKLLKAVNYGILYLSKKQFNFKGLSENNKILADMIKYECKMFQLNKTMYLCFNVF